jgi:glycosyltransferase involved in cell wall biosynthesis
MQADADPAGLIRLVVQQPALPHYRVPVFAELSRRSGLSLRVVHGAVPDLTNAPAAGFRAELVPTRRLRLPGRTLSWQGAQLRLARRREADVLILSWNLNYLSLVPALLRARRQGVATILWGHGYSKRESPRRRWARMRVTGLASGLLLYDRRSARRCVESGVDEARVFVAPNSLDQRPIEAAQRPWDDPARLEEFRRSADLPRDRVVLFVSRLVAANRVDLLVQAAARLRPAFPDLRVLVIGGGPEAEPLRHLARSLELGQVVRFLGPLYDEGALAPYFRCASVFCYPANVGLSLLHAFGYGLPAVTSDHIEAHNPEIDALRRGENGLLYADGDAADLARVLERLLADPALRERLGREARRTVREEFTLEKMVDGMEAAVLAAAATRGRRG